MTSNIVNLQIAITPEFDADAQEQEQLCQLLRQELLQLDIESAQPAMQESLPEGVKAAGAMDWATLLITLSQSGGVLSSVVLTIQSWLGRQDNCSISLEINGNKLDIKGLSDEHQSKLIENWLQNNSAGVE